MMIIENHVEAFRLLGNIKLSLFQKGPYICSAIDMRRSLEKIVCSYLPKSEKGLTWISMINIAVVLSETYYT